MDNLIFVCGHYEGIDQRFIDDCVDEELSIGDFVVTGGEIPAMAITDAVCRLCAGCAVRCGLLLRMRATGRAHWNTRSTAAPPSGTACACRISCLRRPRQVARWRRKQSILRTRERRPDLYAALRLDSKGGQKILEGDRR